MANYDVGLMYRQDPFPSISINSIGGGTTSSSPLSISAGDTITFTNISQDVMTIVVRSISGTQFTSSSDRSIAKGASAVITVKTSPTYSLDDLLIQADGMSKQFFIDVNDGVDTIPADFDIGEPVNSANLSEWYTFEPFKVRGINQAASVSTSNCQFRKNSGTWLTTGTVSDGDLVEVRSLSPSTYTTLVSFSLNIGGVANSNYIRTKQNPSEGARIFFPKTVRPLSLKEVTEFFACPVDSLGNPPREMSAYRRGGEHVPDISENAGITNTNQANDLKLGQFLGTATTVYFEQYPRNKSNFANTISAAQTRQVDWYAGTDWTLGYSPLMKFNIEYRYEFTEYVANGLTTGATFSASTASPSTYSYFNTSFIVSATAPQGTEQMYAGEVKILMRSLIDPTLTLEAIVTYRLNFYGP